jgi:hypothetical protein
MTAAVQPNVDRSDVRGILTGGLQLGALTTVGVVAFALLSRALTGTVEVVVQSVLVVVGGVVFAYLPSRSVRPRTVDGIAWASLVGLLGALAFSVVDTAVLRPLHLYHWTWDRIGGGSGFWYLPVWWMGSAFLAWLGAWIVAMAARGDREPATLGLGLLSAVLGVVLFGLSAAMGWLPFHAASLALTFSIGLVVHVALAAATARR